MAARQRWLPAELPEACSRSTWLAAWRDGSDSTASAARCWPALGLLTAVAGAATAPDIPLFITFDSAIDAAAIRPGAAQVPWLEQEVFVWGADASHPSLSAWLALESKIELSYYMPYSRAPAARLGFTLDWFQAHHPDWVMYRCDRKTVAFWGAETAPHGSVPLDFTNADVIEWQMANQSSIAHRLGYSAMAFDNFGGGARQGANNGQACGVWQRNGSWTQVFQPVPKGDGALDFAEASVRWIEQAKERMAVHAPGLGIVPNLCIDRPSKGGIWTNSSIHGDWATSSAAQRVMAASTGILSERGFSGWGAARAGAGELEDELRWMARLEAAGKGYFTINEVTEKEWSKEWVAWVLGCFLLGKQPHSVSIAVAYSRSLKQENAAFATPDFCFSTGFPWN